MTPTVDRNGLRCAAFHEAGHAVAAIAKQIAFTKVWILLERDARGGHDGLVLGRVERKTDNPALAGQLEKAKDEVIQILAGPFAETLAYANLRPDLGEETNDFKQVRGVLTFALCSFTIRDDGKAEFDNEDIRRKSPDILRIMNECCVETNAFVLRYHDLIADVAASLRAKGPQLTFRGARLVAFDGESPAVTARARKP